MVVELVREEMLILGVVLMSGRVKLVYGLSKGL